MKKEFVLLALQPEANLRRLFGRYGISAACGYKLAKSLSRERFCGFRAKESTSACSSHQTRAPMEREILSLRDQHPVWGGRKLNDGSKIWG